MLASMDELSLGHPQSIAGHHGQHVQSAGHLHPCLHYASASSRLVVAGSQTGQMALVELECLLPCGDVLMEVEFRVPPGGGDVLERPLRRGGVLEVVVGVVCVVVVRVCAVG